MAGNQVSIHGQWSSRWVFILAATGSAVGLGNIWRFPYVTGENGGGAFVLVYLACVLTVGLPIMMAEILIGRRGRQSPINSMKDLASAEGKDSSWQAVGWLGVAAGFLILSFYSVVAGWSVAYVFQVGAGSFNEVTAESSSQYFDALTGSANRLTLWHSIFMLMVIAVVARGVQGGLEKAVKWLMPALFVLLVVMVGYAATTGDFAGAFKYLFEPDFSKINGDTILAALGQAFFSLSLGMGSIIVYGAYLSKNASIPQTALIIGGVDTLVALLAGLAIFPIVFAYGLEPGSGAGLVFVSLTIAFGQMPGGQLFGSLFFMLLTVAAWTSAISLLEPVTAWLVESQKWNRIKAAFVAGFGAWLVGMGSVLSFNLWQDLKVSGKNFFDWSEFLSTTIMLPLGGLCIALFAGWAMSKSSTAEELESSAIVIGAWRILVRYVAPLGVVAIFLNAIGVIQ
ncbi:MAG: sodium-dependent transporter [Pseudomonadota bacterium]